MAKLVELTGVKTYVNSITGTKAIRKGEVACFDDEIADKALEGFRVNAEGAEVPYFTERPAGTPITRGLDFSTKKDSKAGVEVPQELVASAAPTQRTAAKRATR